jgi:hypothetical protein
MIQFLFGGMTVVQRLILSSLLLEVAAALGAMAWIISVNIRYRMRQPAKGSGEAIE